MRGEGTSMMRVVPVIDLKGGDVVRACRGERHLYAPIETPLAATSRPQDVVEGYVRLHDFREIYIADLDAIEGRGSHADAIAALEKAFPSVVFWVDAGVVDLDNARRFLDRHRGVLVLGSESLTDTRALSALRGDSRVSLSFDFRGEAFQGLPQLLADEKLWPKQIIVMTLARVGSEAGPDFARLGEFVTRGAGRHEIFAAGGLRGADDLATLNASGVHGVLVASALHDGRLDRTMLMHADRRS
jgi:phosphoribosylformimino-5-aminoimidazole carboxamide ribotide isomerase